MNVLIVFSNRFLHIFLATVLFFCAVGDVVADPVSGLTEDAPMGFGTIVIDPAGDVITLTAGGSISAQNMSICSGMSSAAQFSADGDASTAVSISFSSGDSLTGAGTAMPIGGFTHNAGVTPSFNGAGHISFNVGANLTINASQLNGSYSGVYTVYVDY